MSQAFFWSSTRDRKGYPIYQIEIHKPFPELNGGQLIRRARVLVRSNRYIYPVPEMHSLEYRTSPVFRWLLYLYFYSCFYFASVPFPCLSFPSPASWPSALRARSTSCHTSSRPSSFADPKRWSVSSLLAHIVMSTNDIAFKKEIHGALI